MANNCDIYMTIDFENPLDADTCMSWLEAQKKAADEEHLAVGFGDTQLYVFDSEVKLSAPTQILVTGWVKWSVKEDELAKFCRILIHSYVITGIKCQYNEPGCELYGFFWYNPENKTLEMYELSEKYLEDARENLDLEKEDDYVQYINAIWEAPTEAYDQVDWEEEL